MLCWALWTGSWALKESSCGVTPGHIAQQRTHMSHLDAGWWMLNDACRKPNTVLATVCSCILTSLSPHGALYVSILGTRFSFMPQAAHFAGRLSPEHVAVAVLHPSHGRKSYPSSAGPRRPEVQKIQSPYRPTISRVRVQ